MGRKRNIFIRDFFTYNRDINTNVCKACSAKFIGENITNLKRHMVQAHMELYRQQESEQYDDYGEHKEDNQKIKISMEISKKEITDICLEFIMKYSQPLRFFDSNAFKILTHQMCVGLKMEPINAENIFELVHRRYLQIKNYIIKTIKGHLVSIKLDKATLKEHTILCINLQVLKNKKLQIYTLAVKDISDTPGMNDFKNILKKVLKEFEINIQQIYTITVGNGDNILNVTEDSKELTNVNYNYDNSEDDEEENFVTPDVLDKPQYKAVIKEEYTTEDDVTNLPDVFKGSSAFTIQCTTYVIELAVQDFLNEADIQTFIDHCRQIVKIIRSPSFRNTLQLLNLEKPLTDDAKIWMSTFGMLESLQKFKNIYSKPKDPLEKDVMLPLKKFKWSDLEELIMILKPVYEITLILQKQQLFLVDFYKSWLTLKSTLKSQDSEKAVFLYSCLENRESNLMNNDILNAARFLDPLLIRTLNSTNKENAKHHLKMLIAKLIEIKPRKFLPKSNDTLQHNSPCTSSSTQNYIWDEPTNSSLLKELSVNSAKVDIENEKTKEIEAANCEIEKYNPSLVDVDLMEYWEEKKYLFPYLRKLAYIIHAVPCTQISMENAFTALKFVLERQMDNLSNDKLDKLLFIKLNFNTE